MTLTVQVPSETISNVGLDPDSGLLLVVYSDDSSDLRRDLGPTASAPPNPTEAKSEAGNLIGDLKHLYCPSFLRFNIYMWLHLSTGFKPPIRHILWTLKAFLSTALHS